MKRIIIAFILWAATAAAGNAQFFVEGSVGVIFWGETTTFEGNSKNAHSNSFNISPLVGFQLNEKIALGVKAYIRYGAEKFIIPDPDTGEEYVLEGKYSGWNFNVFYRYQFVRTKKISFLVESSIYIGGINRKEERTNTGWTSFGIKALPLISYNISERFSLIAACDFLSLNLYSLTANDKVSGSKTKTHHFDFDAKSYIFSNLREIRIGVVYIFNKSDK